jgi:GNAT superfamily N-acetyltransferase
MQIVKAKSTDIPLLIGMMTQFNKEESIENAIEVMEKTLELSFSNPDHVQTYLAVKNEKVIGYVHVCFSFSFEYQGLEASIDEIYVLSEFRGKGLAKEIVRKVETVIRPKGVVVLRADVSDDKPWLNGFYKTIGFGQTMYRPYYKRL